MAKSGIKLTQVFVESVEDDGLYFDQKMSGLLLRKRGKYKNWFFRRYISAVRKEVGIGSAKKLTLQDARKEAVKLSALSDDDFLKKFEKKPAQEEIKKPTFAEVAKKYEEWNIEVGNWPELSKAHRVFLSRMKCHILPVLKDKIFNEITCEDVALVAVPIWKKLDTVDRCLQLIKRIFDWGKAKGYSTHDNPADRQGALKFLLPMDKYKSTNRGALSVQELPLFMKQLHKEMSDSVAFQCGFFAILTATRSQTAREAKWSQIDFEAREWIIPPSQLKVSDNGALIVPLAPEVVEFLKSVKRTDNDLIFPNPKGKVMSDSMISSIVKRLDGKWIDHEQSLRLEKEVRATMHGIARATFRTWAQDDRLGNDKRFDARIAELCLHHKIKDGYNGAYERNQSFIRRREMMEAWSKYCFSLISD